MNPDDDNETAIDCVTLVLVVAIMFTVGVFI